MDNMADGNFMTNHADRNDKIVFPLGRSPDLGSLFTSLHYLLIRLKPRKFILNIGQSKSILLVVRVYSLYVLLNADTYNKYQQRGILLLIFVINSQQNSAWVNFVTNYFQYFSCHFDDIKFICVSDSVIYDNSFCHFYIFTSLTNL